MKTKKSAKINWESTQINIKADDYHHIFVLGYKHGLTPKGKSQQIGCIEICKTSLYLEKIDISKCYDIYKNKILKKLMNRAIEDLPMVNVSYGECDHDEKAFWKKYALSHFEYQYNFWEGRLTLCRKEGIF